MPETLAPAEKPSFVCRKGETILTARIETQRGHDGPTELDFELADASAIGITLVTSPTDARVVPRVYIDGRLVVEPSDLNHGTTVERAMQLEAGAHRLHVELHGQPGAVADVSIRRGGSFVRHDVSTGRHRLLELFDLYAEPSRYLSTSTSSADLSVEGSVLGFGPAAPREPLSVRWGYEIRDVNTCKLLRRLVGESVDLLPGDGADGAALHPSIFSPLASWDGTDEAGQPVPDGEVVYLATADFVAKGKHGERTLDTVTTPQHRLAVDRTAPEISILRPVAGEVLTVSGIDIEARFRDPASNNFASGLDLSSARVAIDGLDVTAFVSLDGQGLGGMVPGLADGLHQLLVVVEDLAGNPAPAATVDFWVDTVPPGVAWLAPPSATNAVLVPVRVAVADTTSGLVLSSLVVTMNGEPLLPALTCEPPGPVGLGASVCSGSAPIEEGEWQLQASVADRGGLRGQAAARVIVDRTAPAVSLILPHDGTSTFTPYLPLQVEWQDPVVNGVASGIDLDLVRIEIDGVDVGASVQLDRYGAFGTLRDLADGRRQLVVRAVDRSGNENRVNAALTIDSTPPVLSWESPAAVTEAANVLFTLRLTDATSGLNLSTLDVSANGQPMSPEFECTPPAGDLLSGATCAASYPLAEGVWSVFAAVEDKVGNRGAATTTVTVDRSGPVLVLDPDIDGSTTAAAVAVLMGRVTDQLPVTLDVNGDTVPIAGGAFATQIALADGTNRISIRASDALGHTTARTVTVRRGSRPPVVSALKLNGTAVACSDSEPEGAPVRVDTTMSPLLAADYADGGAGVHGAGVSLTVDGLVTACASLTADVAALSSHVECPVDLSAGRHRLALVIPDLSRASVRTCAFDALIDAQVAIADPAGPAAGAELQIPTALVPPGAAPAVDFVADPAIGAALASATNTVVGPAVDMHLSTGAELVLAAGRTVRITLPYEPEAFAVGVDLLSEEDARAHSLVGTTWTPEPARQWRVDTLNNTVTYTTSHLSIRAATVASTRPVATTHVGVVVDNGDGGVGDKGLVALDVLNLLRIGDTRPIDPPAVPLNELRAFAPAGMEVTAGDVMLTAFYIKAVKTMPLVNGIAVLTRSVWAMPGTVPSLTLDMDEVIGLSPSLRVLWRAHIDAPDAITESASARHRQLTIRDFSFSSHGDVLYVIGDASRGSRLSAGDGVYRITVSGLAAGQTVAVAGPQARFVVGESASLGVSEMWGPDALFVVGSGPRGWVTDAGRLDLAAATASELTQRLAGFGELNLARHSPYGPGDAFDSYPLASVLSFQASTPCSDASWMVGTDGILPQPVPLPAATLASAMTSDSAPWAAACPAMMSANPAYTISLFQSGAAREPAHWDLASNMLEGGQVLVLQDSGQGLARVGTIVTKKHHYEPSFDKTTRWRAVISDPMSSVAINLSGNVQVWVRQTQLEAPVVSCEARPLACPSGADASRAFFLSQPVATSVLKRVELGYTGPDASLAEAIRAQYADEVDYYSEAIEHYSEYHNFYIEPGVGRSTLANFPRYGSREPGVYFTRYGNSAWQDLAYVSGGGTAERIVSLPPPLRRARPLSTAIASTRTGSGNSREDVILVAGAYDDDGDCSGTYPDCHVPEAFLMRVRRNLKSGTVSSQVLHDVDFGLRFAAGGQPLNLPVAMVGDRTELTSKFLIPKPNLARVAADGSAVGTPTTLHNVLQPALPGLRIGLAHAVRIPTGGSTPSYEVARTSLSTLQDEIDARPLGTPGRSTVAVRVFVADALVRAEELEYAPASGNTSAVVLVAPQPIRASTSPFGGLPDPRLSFLVVSDPMGVNGVSIVADCEDVDPEMLGMVSPYGVAPYGFAAPAAVVPCGSNSDPDAICIDAMPLEDRPGVTQAIYADVVLCGAPAEALGSDKQAQRSLASEPLRAVVGALRCSANDQCASGYCADGFCCDSPCGDGRAGDCMACSIDAGGAEDGACTPVRAGQLCGSPAPGCSLPATCNGKDLTCPLSAQHPGAAEVCNLRDDDCDGIVDEDCTFAVGTGDGPPFDPSADFSNAFERYSDPTDLTYVPPRSASAAVGSATGAFEVLADGSASYRIPIEVPPGRAGMQPSLAFKYSSRRGNGALGVGWSVEGLSEIRICRETFARDGKPGPASLTSGAICLDGNRLVALPPEQNSCGPDWTEYRTTVESFARICGHTRAPVGRDYFRVWRRDGRIAEYGCNIDDPGRPAVCAITIGEAPVAWPLVKEIDRQGNYVMYEYFAARELNSAAPLANILAAAGEPVGVVPSESSFYAIKKISYTGNTRLGDTPTRSVSFEYEDRKDAGGIWDTIAGFTRGRLVAITYRLKEVKSLGPADAIMRSYRLAYDIGPFSGRNRLLSIAECGSDSVCKPATTFDWTSGPSSQFHEAAGFFPADIVDIGCELGDVDGNGLSEFGMLGYPAGVLRCDTVKTDLTGDGIADTVFLSGYGKIYVQSPTGEINADPVWPLSPSLLAGDYDGDGLVELANPFTDYSYHFDSFGGVLLMNWGDDGFGPPDEDGFGPAVLVAPPPNLVAFAGSAILDYDDDGADELFLATVPEENSLVAPNTWYLLAETDGLWQLTPTSDVFPASSTCSPRLRPLDANGDGLRDLLALQRCPGVPERIVLWVNDGVRFREVAAPIDDPVSRCSHEGQWGVASDEFESLAVGDLTGDGADDVIFMSRDWCLAVSEYPEVTMRAISWEGAVMRELHLGIGSEPTIDDKTVRAQDVDGDGLADVLGTWKDPETGEYRPMLFVRDGSTADLMVAVRTGWNSSTAGTQSAPSVAVEYAAPPHDPGVYTLLQDRSLCELHQRCAAPTFPVVKRVSELAGAGQALRERLYSYGDARWGNEGQGWLGFGVWNEIDATNGLSTTRHYANGMYEPAVHDFPYRNIVVLEERSFTSGGSTVQQVAVSTPAPLIQTATSYHAYVGERTVTVTDSAIPFAFDAPYEQTPPVLTTTERFEKDAHGNFTSYTRTARLGSGMRMIPTFLAKTWPWLGQLVSMERAGTSLSIRRAYTYDDSSWLTEGVRVTRESRSAFCRALDGEGPAGADFRPAWATGIDDCPEGGSSVQLTELSYCRADQRCAGRLASVVFAPDDAAARLVTTFDYDDYGNLWRRLSSGRATQERQEQRREHNWYFEPSEHIFLARERNEKGHETTFVFDRLSGAPHAVRLPDGTVRMQMTDAFGRVTGRGASGGVIALTTLAGPESPAQGAVMTLRESGGVEETLILDRLGRAVERRVASLDGETVVTELGYDQLGRVSWATVPRFSGDSEIEYLVTSYDALGRPTEIQGPDGVTTYTYYGTATRKVDGRGNESFRTADAASRPVAVVDAEKGVTRYDYAAEGGLWHAIDDQGNVTANTLDAFGRRVRLSDPDAGERQFAYNAFGETILEADAERTSVYSYDELGRLVRRSDSEPGYATASETVWAWDGAAGAGTGKLWYSESADARRVLGYDSYGRTIQTDTVAKLATATESYSVGLQFDGAGRVARLDYPRSVGADELAVRYEYDASGALRQVAPEEPGSCGASTGPYWRVDAADPRGFITAETFGDGSHSDYTYYERSGRLRSLATHGPGGEVVQDLTLAWDEVGRLAARDDRVEGVAEDFEHDGLGRLRFALTSIDTQLMEVRYDSIGNITYRSDLGAYEYRDAQHPHAVTKAGEAAFAYDTAGQQYYRALGENHWLTRFTAFGKPRSVSDAVSEAEIVRYRYDAGGRRVAKESADALTVYVEGLFEHHVDASGSYDHYYIVAGGRLLAVIRRDAGGACSSPRFVHADHLGSATAITSADGPTIARRFDYWGRIIAGGTSLRGGCLGYGAHEDEPELGLVNMGGRIYDPYVGRFTSPDPFVQNPFFGESLNRYSYALNDPMSLTDPSGYLVEEIGMVIGAVTGSSLGPAAAAAAIIGYVGYSLITGDDLGLGGGSGGSDWTTQPSQSGAPSNDQWSDNTSGSPRADSGAAPGVTPGRAAMEEGNRDHSLPWDVYLGSATEGTLDYVKFISGLGPRVSYYGPDSYASQALRGSSSYEDVWNGFNADMYTNRRFGHGDESNYIPESGYPPASWTETLQNPFLSIVGQYSAYFIPGGEGRVHVIVYNNMSVTSAGHYLFTGRDELQDWDGRLPGGNVYQIFYWVEQSSW